MRVLSQTCAECGAEIAPADYRYELIREPPGGGVTDETAYDEWLCSTDCVSENASRISMDRSSGVLSRIDPLSAVIGVTAGYVVTTVARRLRGGATPERERDDSPIRTRDAR